MTCTFKHIRFFALVFFLFFLFLSYHAQAASLSLSPSTGVFEVGSTFDVMLLLDTEDRVVNAIDVTLLFPADRLQVVSPSVGKSVVSLWLAQPLFDNQKGIIRLQGGIPSGLNVSKGVLATFTFRVKSVGGSAVRFSDDSKVLLHDGKGTDILQGTHSAIFRFVLPPPLGPLLASETHPDDSLWYSRSTAVLNWESPAEVQGYSYVLSDSPIETPDDISEGSQTRVAYDHLQDGTYYFHIKSFRDGHWGGVSHFALNIDTTPPAQFPISVSPSKRTSHRQVVFGFSTSDLHSGLDRYEVRVIPLQITTAQPLQNFFVEAQSPYVVTFEPGNYDFVVRAYDKAGNFREVTERVAVVVPFSRIITPNGVQLSDSFTFSWPYVFGVFTFVLVGLGFVAWRIERWHQQLSLKRRQFSLPPELSRQLEELKQYRKKYGHLVFVLLVLGINVLFSGHSIASAAFVHEVSPPFVSMISRHISNQDIFYIGGRTTIPRAVVKVFIQNTEQGATLSKETVSDDKGDWFYQQPSFLSSGEYVVWTQVQVDDVLSAPSPQFALSVQSTAFQFGASRLSYEAMYVALISFLVFLVISLSFFIVVRIRSVRRHSVALLKEIREAEESLRRGFAVLRRDIEVELATIHMIKLSRDLAAEEKQKEEQLLKDLAWVQSFTTKEIWDVERVARRD